MHRVLAVSLLACCGAARAQIEFTWCGSVPEGRWLIVRAISEDGAVTAGSAQYPEGGGSTSTHAYRWTQATGIVDLGVLPSGFGTRYSEGQAISADGQIVVGYSYLNGTQPVRWNAAPGPIQLPLPTGASGANADAISRSGAVITGDAVFPTESRVIQWVGGLPVDVGRPSWAQRAGASDTSADGSVITGTANSMFAVDERAYVYDSAGWTNLGLLPGYDRSYAAAISGDGRVVVGTCRINQSASMGGFVWTRERGMRPLTAPGLPMCFPMDVSGDGSVIVGAPFTVGNNGVIWTPWSPPRDVGVLLQSLGVNLTGWNEVTAEAVADDGRTIGGTAVSGSTHRAWVARLPQGFRLLRQL
jgi:probable HAF family extracellular repeat protein